jgi:hypothetical protein
LEQSCNHNNVEVLIEMSYILSLKSATEHKYEQKISLILDWRELLLHFYREFEEHYKDITETKETVGDMNGVKASNDSTSPSHKSLQKNLWYSNARPSPDSPACAPIGGLLVWQPKVSRLHLRRYCYCLSPNRGSNRHYYNLASPFRRDDIWYHGHHVSWT